MRNTDKPVDFDNNGSIDDREYRVYEQRARHRRYMAWLSLLASIVSGFALMFFVSDSRLEKLDGLLELYWIGLLGITGTYVGVATWTSKR